MKLLPRTKQDTGCRLEVRLHNIKNLTKSVCPQLSASFTQFPTIKCEFVLRIISKSFKASKSLLLQVLNISLVSHLGFNKRHIAVISNYLRKFRHILLIINLKKLNVNKFNCMLNELPRKINQIMAKQWRLRQIWPNTDKVFNNMSYI